MSATGPLSTAAPGRRQVAFAPEFAAWRRHARRLLAAEVPPSAIDWRPAESGAQLTLGTASGDPGEAGDPAATGPAAGGRRRAPSVPRRFLELARGVACYRDPARWELLYRLLWRLTHGEPSLLEVMVDDDVARAAAMAKAVKRDSHKMKAFVRFRRTVDEYGENGENGEDSLYLAWHRPDHLIVERVAPFFAERFNDQRWAILTPDHSAFWDRSELSFGPGVPSTAAPAPDELEDLWRSYYRSIFNPARLKVRAMKAELPVRHWGTLPEATLIPELIRRAPHRTEEMLAMPDHPPAPTFFPAERSLPALAAAVQACRACPLYADATRAVFGEGPADASLVLVGEQPGDVEDRRGRPFVGPAGEVLSAAMTEAGIDRDAVYMTNAVKHFKFEQRGKRRLHKNPGATEVTACFPWLEAELAEIEPRLIVCLGATASRAVIGPGVRVTRQRGMVLESRFATPAMPTLHPSAVLRIPDAAAREAARRNLTADLAAAWARAAES